MDEKIMVAGAGKSGIAAAKMLLSTGREVLLYDSNDRLLAEQLKGNFAPDARLSIRLGELNSRDLAGIDLCIISPGISLEAPFVSVLNKNQVRIWSEIQLGYRFDKGTLAAITGTNGKTTTTSLAGEIMKKKVPDTFVVGNIGLPYTQTSLQTTADSVTVLEVSSFQLETITDFHPHVSAILNITPDHMDRHHNMETYIRVKEDIARNQTAEDYCILNYMDPILREYGESGRCPAQVVFFSSGEEPEEGLFLRDGVFIYRKDGKEEKLLRTDELQILGTHNHENVMAAMAVGICMGVDLALIAEACREFPGVEHRIEYVTEKNGVKYYNDSKGTNPDAAIKAILAMPGPIVLIGGGYDKKSTYDEWVELFPGRVKKLVLIGKTRDAIAKCAREHGFNEIVYAESLEEAVRLCAEAAEPGDDVLLSPACASWDMFKSYEERGRIFKDCVMNL